MLDLLTIPDNAVIAFECESQKRVHIISSKDAVFYLAGAIKSLRQGCFKVGVIQDLYNLGLISIKILEGGGRTEALKYRCHYYVDKYSNMGYTLESIPKFRATIRKEYDRHEIRVCIVNSKYEKVVVGSFSSENAASNFISKYYEKGIYDLVYKE